jgi:hypothetical protein
VADVERERVTALWREARAALEDELAWDFGGATARENVNWLLAECGRLREQLDAARQAMVSVMKFIDAADFRLPVDILGRVRAALGVEGEREQRVTHGRHCPCSACAREDWTRITGPCGMHGAECPAVYAPLGVEGEPEDAAKKSVTRGGIGDTAGFFLPPGVEGEQEKPT